MSFTGRLYNIFRAPVDFGAQAADLFVDTIRLADDEEFSVFEAFNESWKDNILGKMSASNQGVAGRSVIGSFFGPDTGIGAAVGAIPESIREEPAAVWNLTMDGFNYAIKNFVDRPIGTMVTMASLNPFEARDPVTGMRTGRGFNTKIFDYGTWQNAWELTNDRSAGQAIMLFSGHVDILNPTSVEEFKQTPKYQFVSGIFDAGINVVGDPAYAGIKISRTAFNINRAKKARLDPDNVGKDLFPEKQLEYIDIDGSGNPVPVYRVQPGLLPNESMGPFYEQVRPPVRNQPIIVRTPTREPIRIGGQKLHEKIQQFEGKYPYLETLLGGSVLDMLTIGGGKVVGSTRSVDSLLFEKFDYQPAWMDNIPEPRDIFDAATVPITKELQQIVINETNNLALYGIRPSATYLQTGDLGAAPQFGPDLNNGGLVPAIEIASRSNVLGETSPIFDTDASITEFLEREAAADPSDPFPVSLAEGDVTPVTDEVRVNYQAYKAAYDTYDLDVLALLNRDEIVNEVTAGLRGYGVNLDFNFKDDVYRQAKRDFEAAIYRNELPYDTNVDFNVEAAIARINGELVEAADAYKRQFDNEIYRPDNVDTDPEEFRRAEAELELAEDGLYAIAEQRLQLELYAAHIDTVFGPLEKVKNSLQTMKKVPSTGLDQFYGTGLWNINRNNAAQEIIALRIFQKMPQWGPAFKHMTPEERWQLSKVYATLANAAPVDSSAWLPFHNFIRYVNGNVAVKEAMHAQLKEMSHLWSLLRRVPGPIKDQYNRFPDEFDYDWRTSLGEMDETPGPMAEFPAILERPTSLHWHFSELGRVRKEIASFDAHRKNMGQAMGEMAADDAFQQGRAASLEPTAIPDEINRLDKIHVDHIIDVLLQKEKAHAIFIQHYLFSPQALEDMSIQAAQLELREALDATGVLDEAMYADVAPEDLAGASEALLDYEQRRRSWDDPTKEGIEKFRTMPIKPLNLDAAEIILGRSGDSELAELFDRLHEMQNFPWQAVLADNEGTYKNLMQDVYSLLPANHDLYNPELIVRGTSDIPAAGELNPLVDQQENMNRLRNHEIISPREMHEAAIDNLFQTIDLEIPRTIDGFDSILKPTTKAGLAARTFFEKSGLYAGFTNSRAYKLFSEKVLEGIIDVNNKNQVVTELEKFFRDLERINVSKIMQKHHGRATMLESGEPLSLLDVALMSYRSNLPTWEGISLDNRPTDKGTSQLWADQTLIDLVDTPPERLGPKLDRLINGVLTGFVESIVPDKKFDGLTWTGPDVRSNLITILRGELSAVKKMLEESADATGKKYGNVDFTDVIGTNELGETVFVRKPIAPSQVRQTVIMPRIDRWKDLERALMGDFKSIEIAGKQMQIGLTPARATLRNLLMETQSTWKTINLLTPRWQMVVNIDSQLRLQAALETSLGVARIGPAFNTLQARWLRNDGVDIQAIVQNELFEELGGFERITETQNSMADIQSEPDLLEFDQAEYFDNVKRPSYARLLEEEAILQRRNFIEMVDLYLDDGQDIVEFVTGVIEKEYARRQTKRLGTATALGLYFTGPVGAAAAAGAYTAHSRTSIANAARRMVAESYGIAARNAAWVSLREAEAADMFNWLAENYPGRYQTISDDLFGVESLDQLMEEPQRFFPADNFLGTANTTESKMYAALLAEKNVLEGDDVASYINDRIYEEVIDPYTDAANLGTYTAVIPVSQITTADFYRNASAGTRKIIDARINELKRTLSAREQTDILRRSQEGIPDYALEGIENLEDFLGDADPILAELANIVNTPELVQNFEVIGIENFYSRPLDEFPFGGLDVPPASQVDFLSSEKATDLIGEHFTLLDLAAEANQAFKDRRRAAELISNNVEAVSDYDKTVVQGFQTEFPHTAQTFERAAQILTEGGFSTTQIGSTRIDSAFGNIPSQQEINRRNISANNTARIQIQGANHIQRRKEKFQGSHQYDFMNRVERDSFVAAYNDFADRILSAKGPEGVTADRDFWRQFIRTPNANLTDAEILQWLRTDGRQVIENWVPRDQTPEELTNLVFKARYESMSQVPAILPGFEAVVEKFQAGTTITWQADIVPALDKLQKLSDSTWDQILKAFIDDNELRQIGVSSGIPAFDEITGVPLWDSALTMWDSFRDGKVLRWIDATGNLDIDLTVDPVLRRLMIASYESAAESIITNTGQLSFDQRMTAMTVAKRRDIVEQIRLLGERNIKFVEEVEDVAFLRSASPASIKNSRPLPGEEGLRDFGRTVTDSQFLDSKQTATIWERIKQKITQPLENLGEVESSMSRGVMYDALYTADVIRRLQPFKVGDAYHISDKRMYQLQEKARKWARVETNNQLYDLASRTRIEEMLWLVAPFFGAWQEVLGRWFSLAYENPVFVARGLRPFALLSGEDENGQSIATFQLPNIIGAKTETDWIPFVESVDWFGDLSILSEMPMDLKLGSGSFIAALPGVSPAITVGAGEAILAVPSLDKTLGWLIPYGIAEGDNTFTRILSSLLPAWTKNIARKGLLNKLYLDDDRRKATAARVLIDMMVQYNEQGIVLPTTGQALKDFNAEAKRRTEMIYGIRSLRNLAVPTSALQQSPYYPVIKEYWKVLEEHGPEIADAYILENHFDMWPATARTQLTIEAIAGTRQGHENYELHKQDATEYQEIASWIIGQVGPEEVKWEYNRNIRRLETLEGRVRPLTLGEQFEDATATQGWREWKDFRIKLYADLAQRKKAGLSGAISSHYDLVQKRRSFIHNLGQQFPAWHEEFYSTNDPLKVQRTLAGFRHVVKDPAYAKRLDVVQIGQFLDLHDGIARDLEMRAKSFNSSRWERLSYKGNEDLRVRWELGIAKLLLQPDFGNVYDRFFSNIETVSVGNSPLREPATLGSAR